MHITERNNAWVLDAPFRLRNRLPRGWRWRKTQDDGFYTTKNAETVRETCDRFSLPLPKGAQSILPVID